MLQKQLSARFRKRSRPYVLVLDVRNTNAAQVEHAPAGDDEADRTDDNEAGDEAQDSGEHTAACDASGHEGHSGTTDDEQAGSMDTTETLADLEPPAHADPAAMAGASQRGS